ncbi:MAG: Peptidase [Cyanobacteria bacterium RYN_339]|nr:Peptidase [Cyanobacteria bacterium RYN_339]
MLTALLVAAALDPLALGHRAQTEFMTGKVDPLCEQFTPELRAAFPNGKADFQAFQASVFLQAGAPIGEGRERAWRVAGGRYVFIQAFLNAPAGLQFSWTFDPAGRASGLLVGQPKPPVANPYETYQLKTSLRLPFTGRWTVFWGGRTVEENYHAAYRDQRYALDLEIMQDGATHAGDGKRNEQYYCFHQPIVAPAAAQVVEALDGLPDNPPGVMDPKNAAGNHVLLDFGNGEYALLAHLSKGSVRVKAGQAVQAGDRLGLCGNSGNTSEPHLHFHVQDGPKLFAGDGRPAQFLGYKRDGVAVERGEPSAGQVIEPN